MRSVSVISLVTTEITDISQAQLKPLRVITNQQLHNSGDGTQLRTKDIYLVGGISQTVNRKFSSIYILKIHKICWKSLGSLCRHLWV